MGQDDTKHNLLFISKYPEIIHEFTDAMKDRDIEIETAINGIEAAAKIKKKNYDIVITGLSLEGYNGEQIITYLNKTAPSTVCIIYTTTISSAQLHFFINERNVFRVFLRPVDFRGAFWEALEEAYEYHAVQVKNEEDTGARRQEQEKQEREIEIMDQRMRSQRQARETTNRYMKRLAGLTIKKGELMAVIGKSGSGKSTLLNMIGGLERPTAGKLYVDGKDLFAMTDKELVEYRKHTVGFVWQKNSRNLLPYMTALENVQVPMYFDKDNKEDRESRAYDLLCKVGLKEKVNSYPAQMSGGEQQRVAIAIALANNPKILLADEPTGAVDSKTSDMIQDLFRKLNEEMGITVIIVTHDISLANKVGRVVMIADGKISTEKIMKEDYRKRINDMESESFNGTDSHEEYSIMDKAHRVQISDDILEAAGIDTNKVKIQVVDGKVVISKE